jgi:hypothetical protein
MKRLLIYRTALALNKNKKTTKLPNFCFAVFTTFEIQTVLEIFTEKVGRLLICLRFLSTFKKRKVIKFWSDFYVLQNWESSNVCQSLEVPALVNCAANTVICL